MTMTSSLNHVCKILSSNGFLQIYQLADVGTKSDVDRAELEYKLSHLEAPNESEMNKALANTMCIQRGVLENEILRRAFPYDSIWNRVWTVWTAHYFAPCSYQNKSISTIWHRDGGNSLVEWAQSFQGLVF